jgi:hypothetical protein
MTHQEQILKLIKFKKQYYDVIWNFYVEKLAKAAFNGDKKEYDKIVIEYELFLKEYDFNPGVLQ